PLGAAVDPLSYLTQNLLTADEGPQVRLLLNADLGQFEVGILPGRRRVRSGGGFCRSDGPLRQPADQLLQARGGQIVGRFGVTVQTGLVGGVDRPLQSPWLARPLPLATLEQ